MSKESKELRAKRFKLVEDSRALIVAPKDAAADWKPSAEDSAKFEAVMIECDALKVRIDQIERADELHASMLEDIRNKASTNRTDPEQEKERADLEASTFRTWMRHGPAALNEAQRTVFNQRFQNALGTSPDTAGGFTVPQGFYATLIDAQLAYGGMINESFVFDTATGNTLPIPTDNDTTNKGVIIGENTQVTSQDVAFGAINLNAWTYSSKLVLVSNQLLQDTVFNLDGFLAGKLATRLARIENDHFTTGNAASQPNGIVNAATLGTTGATGETVTLIFDDLVELEHSVDPAYRQGAKFMMHDTTLKIIKKLKDGIGRPLWMAGLMVKEPDTINGYSYSINQSMAVPAANAKSVIFGDLRSYYIRRVTGVQVLRLVERYADFNQVGFLAFQRMDGNLIDAGTHPVKYFQHSAT